MTTPEEAVQLGKKFIGPVVEVRPKSEDPDKHDLEPGHEHEHDHEHDPELEPMCCGGGGGVDH